MTWAEATAANLRQIDSFQNRCLEVGQQQHAVLESYSTAPKTHTVCSLNVIDVYLKNDQSLKNAEKGEKIIKKKN